MDVMQFQPPLPILEGPIAPFKMHDQQETMPQQEQSLIQSSDQVQKQVQSEYDKSEPNYMKEREENPSYYKHVPGTTNLENGHRVEVKLESCDEIDNFSIKEESSIINGGGGISMSMKNDCLSPILNITNTNNADTSSVQTQKACNVSSRFESSNTNVVKMAPSVSVAGLSEMANSGISNLHADLPVMNKTQIPGYTINNPFGVVGTNDGPLNTPEIILEGAKKREIRLYKNREAARECRNKKKEYVKCLENRVAVLENQNKALIEELKSLKELYCSGNR